MKPGTWMEGKTPFFPHLKNSFTHFEGEENTKFKTMQYFSWRKNVQDNILHFKDEHWFIPVPLFKGGSRSVEQLQIYHVIMF